MLKKNLLSVVQSLSRYAGYELQPIRRVNGSDYPVDFSDTEIGIYSQVKPLTLTSVERIIALIRAVAYVALNRISGSIVECGAWRGGSMMAVALTLLRLNQHNVPLFLFDTFEGMSEPSKADGPVALHGWKTHQKVTHNEWCYASLEEVKKNLLSTKYSSKLVTFVKGKVEDTLPGNAPTQIAVLRLDTDWFESTKHALVHLCPRIEKGGILIVDDYGHWEGCKKAVDEYIREQGLCLFLNRIDYTGRIAVIP